MEGEEDMEILRMEDNCLLKMFEDYSPLEARMVDNGEQDRMREVVEVVEVMVKDSDPAQLEQPPHKLSPEYFQELCQILSAPV